jgi:hypothetical protein
MVLGIQVVIQSRLKMEGEYLESLKEVLGILEFA